MQNPNYFTLKKGGGEIDARNRRLILISDLNPHTLIEIVFRPSEIVIIIPSARKIQFILLRGYLS